MANLKTVKVIITQPVAVAGKHYQPSDKPVSVSEEAAAYLIPRRKAKLASKKASD